jgi:ABC-type polysaccharide/polyol phosphate export permease
MKHSLRRRINSFIGLLYFYVLAYIVRAPSSAPLLVLRMSIFIALLSIIAGKDYAIHVLSGALVALAFGAGLSQFSVDVNALRVSGYRYLLLNTPLGPISFAVATATGMSLLSFIGMSVFFIPWYYLCKPSALGLFELLVVLALTWLCGLLIGFLLTVFIKTPHVLFNVTDTVYALLVYLMPVYYPLKLIPVRIRAFTLISSATHGAVLVREIALKGHITTPGNLEALLAAVIVLLLATSKLTRWRED